MDKKKMIALLKLFLRSAETREKHLQRDEQYRAKQQAQLLAFARSVISDLEKKIKAPPVPN